MATLADDLDAMVDYFRIALAADVDQVFGVQGVTNVVDLLKQMRRSPSLAVSFVGGTRESGGNLRDVRVLLTLLTKPNTSTGKTRYSENLRILDQVEAAALANGCPLPPNGDMEWRSVFKISSDRDYGVSMTQTAYTSRCVISPDPDDFDDWTTIAGDMLFKNGDDPGALIQHEEDLT